MNRTTKVVAGVAAAFALGAVATSNQSLHNPARAVALAEAMVTPTPGGGPIVPSTSGDSLFVPVPTATFAVPVPTATFTPIGQAPSPELPLPKAGERGNVFFSAVTDAGVDASPLISRASSAAIYKRNGFSDVRLHTQQGAAGGLARLLDVSLYVKDPIRVGQQLPVVSEPYTEGATLLYTQARGSSRRNYHARTGSVTIVAFKDNRIQVQLNDVRLELADETSTSPADARDFVLSGTLNIKGVQNRPVG